MPCVGSIFERRRGDPDIPLCTILGSGAATREYNRAALRLFRVEHGFHDLAVGPLPAPAMALRSTSKVAPHTMSETTLPPQSRPFRFWLEKTLGVPLRVLGIEPSRTLALRHLPKYIADCRRFQRAGGRIAHYFPILEDYTEPAGSARGHYFHQDLLVASYIYQAKPRRHVDIGSRIDGFVAHVASFRQIEVLDVRALRDTSHENIKFLQADLMVDAAERHRIADSISCLHAIEHFGLGRYGDPINPSGHILGFENIVKMLQDSGTLYVSFPIGRRSAVYFNAHRVFHPTEVFGWTKANLELLRFDFVDDAGELHRDFPLPQRIPVADYGCGIYTFRKRSS